MEQTISCVVGLSEFIKVLFHTLSQSMVKEKEEKMLARDLLQMEVNRLHGILNIKTGFKSSTQFL